MQCLYIAKKMPGFQHVLYKCVIISCRNVASIMILKMKTTCDWRHLLLELISILGKRWQHIDEHVLLCHLFETEDIDS